MNLLKWSITLIAGLFSSLVWAHHGWSGYDDSKPRTETGVVTEFGFENPHGFIKLEVDKKLLYIVLAPPSRMSARGLEKASLAPGSKVTILGYQHRMNAEEMRAERITIDGKTTELR